MSDHGQFGEHRRGRLLMLYDKTAFLYDLSGTDYDEATKKFKTLFDQEQLDSTLQSIICFPDFYPQDSQLTEEKQSRLFHLILDLGASPNCIYRPSALTPILLCVLSNKLKQTEELLKRGANPNATYSHRDDAEPQQVSCLKLAVIRDNTEMVGLLLKYGATETRFNDLLRVAVRCCPHNASIMPLLVEGHRNWLDANPETTLVHFMFRHSWENFEEHYWERMGGVELQKGSEDIMKNVVYLMSKGWAGPTGEMLVTLMYKGRFGALVEYLFGCLDNGLPMVLPSQLDFQSVNPEEILAQQIRPGQFYPNRGRSIASAILRRISSRPGEVKHMLSELDENAKNEYMVPRLENLSIISLRNCLLRHPPKGFRGVCRGLPLPSTLVDTLTLDDLKLKFENEIKDLEGASAQI